MANGLRIMLVDDNADFLEILSLDVQDLGFPTVTASSVDEALAKLKSSKVDIIVSDLHMDGKSGMDFIEELRNKRNLIPFIFLTGAATKNVAVEALRNGAFDLLEKPIEPVELARVLRSAGKLVRRIHTDSSASGDDSSDDNLRMLRSSARAFDDLVRDSGIKPDIEIDFDTFETNQAFSALSSNEDTLVSLSAPVIEENLEQAANRIQVKGHIEALLSRSETAIKQLGNGQFARTSLSFLCRSFNIARESAEKIDDFVLSGACEVACSCFSYFRVSPAALSAEHIELFAKYNDYLKDLNRHGSRALKKHSATIAAVQRIEKALDAGAA
jgi:CheY-like chemotaxis protein